MDQPVTLMLPKGLQYVILAVGLVTAAVVVFRYIWPERVPDSPEVLEQQILEGSSVDVRSQAAHDMIYHGEQARGSAGEALTRYQGNEPEVLVPLIQAAQKARDWRCLPRLFAMMEHSDPWIRGKAGAAARSILGADYGFRSKAPPEERAAALEKMRQAGSELEARFEQLYPDRE